MKTTTSMKATKNNQVKMYVCLGTQPIVTTTKTGKRLANFFAMNTSAKKECVQPENTNTPSTKWFRVTTWGDLADTAGRHLTKGKKVLLMGNMVTQEYTNRKGEVKTKEVIVASNLVLLDSGNGHRDAEAA